MKKTLSLKKRKMCIFVHKICVMKRQFFLFAFLLLFPLLGLAQNAVLQNNKPAFETAYEACPDIPPGLFEAISFTNTHCYHLTDDNYFHDGPNAMPRAYGLMGLVKDGKNYFRENLHLMLLMRPVPLFRKVCSRPFRSPTRIAII